jgi:cyclohexanecarboxylate-CoA ligase
VPTAAGAPEWHSLLARAPGALAAVEPGHALTVDQLASVAQVTAGRLTDAGVRRGDRVVVALPSSLGFVSTYLAVRLCGAVLVNLPWQWRRELLAVVDETEARAVILDDRVDRAVAERLAAVAVTPAWMPGDASDAGVEHVSESTPTDAVAWLAYSSGTTAAPKGAVHTEETLRLIADGFVRRYDLGLEDVVLVAAPTGHAVGFVYGVQLALAARCPMVLMPKWDVEEFARLLERHRCTFVAAPTPYLVDVVGHAERVGADAFAGLRLFLSGGARVSEALLARARVALPGTDVSAYYGTSECGGVTSCPPAAPEVKKLTTDGLPLPGMEVRIEGGELLVRGPQLARGYWGGGESWRFRDDGWFATGDEATCDADGYIRILGRLDDLIMRGGVNVSPLEVEEVLLQHRHVRDVAVVGAPDVRLGERVAAVMVVAEPVSLDDLREHCRCEGLAKVKWPELIVPVDALPRSPSGKILRADLRQRLADA